MKIKPGDVVYHKTAPGRPWVVLAKTEDGAWSCQTVTDGCHAIEYPFLECELVAGGVLNWFDLLAVAARRDDADPAFMQELKELRERYAETLVTDTDTED